MMKYPASDLSTARPAKRLPAQARRQQILDAAHDVVLEKGLANAATRDVTRRLGVGSGLLHHYFKSWDLLRAEVLETFISREIDALSEAIDAATPKALPDILIDWMLTDPTYRNWTLWLDAIEQSRRDSALATVVHEGYLRWHNLLKAALIRAATAPNRSCPAPDAAAWRVSLLIDGFAGALASQNGPSPKLLSSERVRAMLSAQLDMELRKGNGS